MIPSVKELLFVLVVGVKGFPLLLSAVHVAHSITGFVWVYPRITLPLYVKIVASAIRVVALIRYVDMYNIPSVKLWITL